MEKNITRSAIIVIVLTMASKVLGFGREMVIAALFGATALTDAFNMALTIPTLLYSGVGSAVNSVFIPVYDRFRKQKRDKSLVIRFILIGLVVTALLFVLPIGLFSKQLVKLFAVGFDDATASITAGMVKILCVMILFRFLSSVTRAVLHVNRNFVIPAMDGFPYNLVIIGVSFALYQKLGIYALVWGTLFGVASQTLFKLPWLLKTKMHGDLKVPSADGLKEILHLLPPVILGSMASQIKSVTDKMFASTLAEGSISYLNYSSRLVGLPQGLLVASIITVVYPSLVDYINSQEYDKFRDTFTKAINSMQFLLIPMVVGFVALALPITQLVFQRGNFDTEAVIQTAIPLRFYSIGLIGTMLSSFSIKAFYAMGDAKTPLLVSFGSISINVLLNFLFIGSLKHGGLALATSLSHWFGGVLLVWLLARKIGGLKVWPMLADAGKSLAASLLMGIVVYFIYNILMPLIPSGRLWAAVLLAAVIILGAGIYFLCAILFKAQGTNETKALIKKIWQKIFSQTEQGGKK
jgi:putative peptidoglycan lipid II flippase